MTPPDWDGEERRHCPNHERNTTDIAAIKASGAVMKWMLGGLGAFLLFALSYLGTVLAEIKADGKANTGLNQQIAVSVAGLQAQTSYISQRLDAHERNER